MKKIYTIIYKSLEEDQLNCKKSIAEQKIMDKTVLDYVKNLAEYIKSDETFYFETPTDFEPDSYILLLDIYRPLIDKNDLKRLTESSDDISMLAYDSKLRDTGIYFMKSECFSGLNTSDYLQKASHVNTDNEFQFVQLDNKYLLMQAVSELRDKINMNLLNNGVMIINPASTYISGDAVIAADTIIYPNVFIEGKTIIGENCVIGSNTRIVESVLADNVSVEQSVILNSEIGEGTNVGPFAYVRPHTSVGKHCKIGDFVEVKNSVIGDNTKASHLTYIGDADVGNDINFGCGTVTVNYDGAYKSRTVIKDKAFIGCNSNLIAPVTIEENAYVAAGSTITDNVPESTLAIARARQVVKTNWKRPVKKTKN